MKKKILIFVILAILLAVGAFAQSHWISLEHEGIGGGLRYEYVITPIFTVGGCFSYNALDLPTINRLSNIFSFGATARWYPFAGKFFVELSLGVSIFQSYEEVYGYYNDMAGFCIAPGLGWTWDVGKAGSWFLAPGARFPIIFGDEVYFTIVPYFGIGLAF